MNTNIPRPTFEQVFRPLLAIVFILAFWATYPHADATTEPYTGPITVRTYAFPETELANARLCIDAEREARGIPDERNAYLVWWNENKGTETQREWSAAHARCKDQHFWKQGKWNWTSLVLVKEEVHNG